MNHENPTILLMTDLAAHGAQLAAFALACTLLETRALRETQVWP